jgi:hypothetical protein
MVVELISANLATHEIVYVGNWDGDEKLPTKLTTVSKLKLPPSHLRPMNGRIGKAVNCA